MMVGCPNKSAGSLKLEGKSIRGFNIQVNFLSILSTYFQKISHLPLFRGFLKVVWTAPRKLRDMNGCFSFTDVRQKQLSSFECFLLRCLNTVLAVYEYVSFAKSWQEKGCSSEAATWQVKSTPMKHFN